MWEVDKNPARRELWDKTTKTFDDLHAKPIDLPEAKYDK